jgi:hypothetical protein
MKDHIHPEPRSNEVAAKRTPSDIDRFENEGGCGPEDTRNENPGPATDQTTPRDALVTDGILTSPPGGARK